MKSFLYFFCLLTAAAYATSPHEGFVNNFLSKYCIRCHGSAKNPKTSRGKFGSAANLAKMLEEKRIVPGDPENSSIYSLVKNREMPTSGLKPSVEEIRKLKESIQSLKLQKRTPPREFFSSTEVLDTLYKDLSNFSAAEQSKLRYLSLLAFWNSKTPDGGNEFSADSIEVFTIAIRFLINSLSFSSNQIQVTRIKKTPLLRINFNGLRFIENLEHFGIKPANWKLIGKKIEKQDYLFTSKQKKWRDIIQMTNTAYPLLPAHSFASRVTVEPDYYDIMNFPTQLKSLEKALGISLKEEIRKKNILRALTVDSGPSSQHRVIEVVDIGKYKGTYWKSYDFLNNEGKRNVFQRPLGPRGIFPAKVSFESDGGEIIFHLPNGLFAFVLVDQSNEVLFKAADTNIVSDSRKNRVAVRAAINCFGCHANGLRQAKNALKPGNEKNFVNDFISKVYHPKKLNKEMALANVLFRTKKQKLKGLAPESTVDVGDALIHLVDLYDFSKISKERFKSELLLSEEDFQKYRKDLVDIEKLYREKNPGSSSHRTIKLRISALSTLERGGILDRKGASKLAQTKKNLSIYINKYSYR